MKSVQLAAILLAVLSPDAFGASLPDFAGEWRGTGTFTRQTTTQQKGRLTCRLNIVAEGENVIVVNGRCAAPQGSRGFKTKITAGKNGAISGLELSGAGTQKSRRSNGWLGSSGLNLLGKDAKGSFEFSLSTPHGGKMEMQSAADNSGKGETARVQLKKVN